MHVFIVEPSRTIQAIITQQFTEMGVLFNIFDKGADMLEHPSIGEVDLICTSLHPADMGGLDLCRKIRQTEMTALMPILLLTSEEDKDVHFQAFKLGVTEIFQKNNIANLLHYVAYLSQQSMLHKTVSGQVLYIEDMPSQAMLLVSMLEAAGLSVKHYYSAEAGYDDFCQNDYDLVITDVVLAGEMSGLSLVRAIRSKAGLKGRIPILAVSGIESAARRVELLKCGINDYVAKPVLEMELITRVKNLMMAKQLNQAVEQHQQNLQSLTMTDQLTGLYNRHFIQETMEKALARAERKAQSICLILLDIDHFKQVNDQLGHQKGDVVLKEIAQALLLKIREGDFAVRFGGEEYLLILFDCDLEAAQSKADLYRQTIAGLHPAGLSITASFGVTCFNHESKNEDFDSLINRADTAMYQAKKNGRNAVVCA